jgi:hypothetical protein
MEKATIREISQFLRDLVTDWRRDPESWGDNEKDYRNHILDVAQELDELL